MSTMTFHRTVSWMLGFVVLGLASPSPALAELGGDATSITLDSSALGGSRRVTVATDWEVHELQLPSGTLVREYLRAGTVFAVAWGGPVLPNQRRLLGSYFEPYVNSPRGRTSGHHQRVVATPDWVVQSAGHQGGFIGRAWIPSKLPAGFDLDTVRAW
jgi:hypothetical protein